MPTLMELRFSLMTIDKVQTRAMLTHFRKHLNLDDRQHIAMQVAAKIRTITSFLQSQHVGVYLAHQGEVDTALIIQYARKQHKQLYLPVIDSSGVNLMRYYAYQTNAPMTKNRYGIEEPSTHNTTPIALEMMDVVITPLIGFDEKCNRLGHGKGYYDHTFAFVKQSDCKNKPVLIGLGYEFQKIPSLIPADWDVPLDYVVTEKAIYQR